MRTRGICIRDTDTGDTPGVMDTVAAITGAADDMSGHTGGDIVVGTADGVTGIGS